MNLIVDILYAFLDPRVRYCMAPLLEVQDLQVHFQTEDGLVQAVDGVTYAVERRPGRSASSASPARASRSRR